MLTSGAGSGADRAVAACEQWLVCHWLHTRHPQHHDRLAHLLSSAIGHWAHGWPGTALAVSVVLLFWLLLPPLTTWGMPLGHAEPLRAAAAVSSAPPAPQPISVARQGTVRRGPSREPHANFFSRPLGAGFAPPRADHTIATDSRKDDNANAQACAAGPSVADNSGSPDATSGPR